MCVYVLVPFGCWTYGWLVERQPSKSTLVLVVVGVIFFFFSPYAYCFNCSLCDYVLCFWGYFSPCTPVLSCLHRRISPAWVDVGIVCVFFPKIRFWGRITSLAAIPPIDVWAKKRRNKQSCTFFGWLGSYAHPAAVIWGESMPSWPTPWRFELSSWPGQSHDCAVIRSIKFYGTLILHWKFVVLASRRRLRITAI